MLDIKPFLARLTHHSGVYQMLGKEGIVLYIGKAKDLKKRVSSYFNKQHIDPKTRSLLTQVVDIDVTITHSETEALLLECNLIKKHRPKYNILLRDDKSYPYILLTAHPFPRIDLYRGGRQKQGQFFGPYPSAYAARDAISTLQKIFKLRTCQEAYFNARTRPCLLHEINRCTAPCVNLISEEAYAKQVQLAALFLIGKNNQVIESLQEQMEKASLNLAFEAAAQLRDQIARLRQVQNKQYAEVKEGNVDALGIASENRLICLLILTIRGGQIIGSRSYFPAIPLDYSLEEIVSAFISQHYLGYPPTPGFLPRHVLLDHLPKEADSLEQALSQHHQQRISFLQPQRGDKRKWLEMATASAKQSLAAKQYQLTDMHQRFSDLQAQLNLPLLPKRIECFDVSHTLGEATVASCVVFDQNGPVKSAYRRFNIEGVSPGDDVAAIQQAVFRRYKNVQDDSLMPDIILIDGGRTQLAAGLKALQSLKRQAFLVGVSKGQGRKAGYESLHLLEHPPFHLPADAKALHLIQQARDEAHRFAITAHRARRDKVRKQSSLEEIPGIGQLKRRDLLRYFGGIQGVARASLDELTKVHGISRALAERIFAALHDDTL